MLSSYIHPWYAARDAGSSPGTQVQLPNRAGSSPWYIDSTRSTPGTSIALDPPLIY